MPGSRVAEQAVVRVASATICGDSMTSLAPRPVSPTNTRPQRGGQASKDDKLPPANGRSPPGGAAEGGSRLVKTKSATTLVKVLYASLCACHGTRTSVLRLTRRPKRGAPQVMKATKALTKKKPAGQAMADDADEE